MKVFKRNLMFGYGFSLMLLVISSVASYISIKNLLESASLVNHTNEIAKKLEGIISLLKDAETGQRGFLLTGRPEFLEPYNGAYDKANNLVIQIKNLTTDNPAQTADINALQNITLRRINYLSALIDKKRNHQPINDSMLLMGKTYMDNARALVKSMQERETTLLAARTSRMNRFATNTPVVVVIASILAILVTCISFVHVMSDFRKRWALQAALQRKDEDISERLRMVESVSGEISAGNFKVRVDDNGNDSLSGIAISLNKMAGSLDDAFKNLSEKEWLQTGVASLNDIMIGEHDLSTLSKAVLGFAIEYTSSNAGAFYVLSDHNELELKSSYALTNPKSSLNLGEGLTGQAAANGRIIQLPGIEQEDYTLSFIAGEIRPKNIVAIPLLFNKRVNGVIELAFAGEFSPAFHNFFKALSYNTGIAVNTAQNRQRVQNLLEETQSQAEELQAQHTELENINSELETQAEKLQASEEELKVQQEELQQANQELEERSRLLEEKNELILERNLEIQSKAEELEISTKYKSEFLANMSHELRTPLNSILLLSRLLSENHESNLLKEQVEYANVIQSSGKGLLTLIDEILDLSKIESGKMELEFTEVSIKLITGELHALFDAVAKEKAIDFIINIQPGTAGTITTDRLRLEQILRNLISNALKFTKNGSVSLNISGDANTLSFAITDTGIGIPENKQETIFEAFKQADGSTRRQYGGTGLGLSISRELARLLGGEIRLVSEEGKGSVFTLMVPVKENGSIYPEQEKTATDTLEKPGAVTEVADKEFISDIIPASIDDDRNTLSEQDKVILIIEDDINFARSLLEYTRAKGYKGIVAVRGDEGIELARKYLPLGILLDIQLPVRNGWQVMDDLKANPSTRPIPVHIMSSHEAKNKSLSKGAIDFINKPVAFEKLAEVFLKIEEALNRYPKKVLIVEENTKHAQALAYFLQNYNVASDIKNSVGEGIKSLNKKEVDCVILDMGIPAQKSYDTLEEVKKTPGLENIPIIIFTGKNLSANEELKIKKYADSIIIKTAHSYQRILDEVSLFLHIVEENKKENKSSRYQKLGEFVEVLKGKTILVADDDVRNIFSITRSLENFGMNVVTAIDGKDAINQLETTPKIDLVLMDMMMPEMDGYESTRHIRENPKYRNLPIIAVTAKAMTGDREKCIKAGASDYITKPVDIDQLISLLRVWLYQ